VAAMDDEVIIQGEVFTGMLILLTWLRELAVVVWTAFEYDVT